MNDIVEQARKVVELHGDTYSSYEVVGLLGQLVAEIERLQQLYRDAIADLNQQIEDKQFLAGEIERLRAGVLWHCEACGTLTHDDNCDCTRTGTGTQQLVRFDPKPMSDEIEQLRADLNEAAATHDLMQYEIMLLRALLKRHDNCWRLLHKRQYRGELHDDTRAALGDAPKYDANFHPEGWDEVDGND
jgi:hypothetical protein